jgi:D-alanyl-D-alanine carboxypeptidase
MGTRNVIAAALSCLAVGSAEADMTGLQADLQATLDAFRETYALPGATAAIAFPDGSVVTVATGFADVENGRLMAPETPMLAASIGKTFVAMTVLALEGRGLLSQGDLVSGYLGGETWFEELPNADTMTLGHLLHHQSGLPDHPHMPDFQRAAGARFAAGEAAFAPEEILGFVRGTEPLFAAGEGWAYSDTGYILLGLVIEEVTGRAYYDLLSETFLEPLGLDATTPSDRTDIPGLAVGYTTEGNPFDLRLRTADPEGRLLWDPAVEWTGGGLASTSADLARWGHLLFGGAALGAPYLDRLLDAVPLAPDAPGILYGAGVAVYSETSRGPVYGHGGWIPAYVSSLRHYADHGVTVTFQINTDAGVVDDSSDVVPSLEAALADLAIAAAD